MFLFRHLPNALTCCNLLCGCFGIVLLFNKETALYAPWFVWWACIFDFLDGFVARLLKVSSPIGKELDSLADMVTFGLLPSLYMFVLMRQVSPGSDLAFVAFMIAVFSAVRLAKFNVDERQIDGFIGVPTPATALFITAFPFAVDINTLGVYGLFAITVVFSLLMVAPFRLFALKFKNFAWKGNELRFTFLAIAVLLIAFLQEAAIAAIIIMYILVSLFVGWRGAGTDSK